MYSVMSVCDSVILSIGEGERGFRLTITHDALYLIVQAPRYGTPPVVTYGGQCWRPVQTSSVEDPSPTSADIWWLLNVRYVRFAQAGGTHATGMLFGENYSQNLC